MFETIPFTLFLDHVLSSLANFVIIPRVSVSHQQNVLWKDKNSMEKLKMYQPATRENREMVNNKSNPLIMVNTYL